MRDALTEFVSSVSSPEKTLPVLGRYAFVLGFLINFIIENEYTPSPEMC